MAAAAACQWWWAAQHTALDLHFMIRILIFQERFSMNQYRDGGVLAWSMCTSTIAIVKIDASTSMYVGSTQQALISCDFKPQRRTASGHLEYLSATGRSSRLKHTGMPCSANLLLTCVEKSWCRRQLQCPGRPSHQPVSNKHTYMTCSHKRQLDLSVCMLTCVEETRCQWQPRCASTP
jgi:hypothetical protein